MWSRRLALLLLLLPALASAQTQTLVGDRLKLGPSTVTPATAQVRVGVDGSNYCDIGVGADGKLTLDCTGTAVGTTISDALTLSGALAVTGNITDPDSAVTIADDLTVTWSSGTALGIAYATGIVTTGGDVVLGGTLSDPDSAVIVDDAFTVNGNTVFGNATSDTVSFQYARLASYSLLWSADGGGSIGAAGANRPANLYTSGLANIGTSLAVGTTANIVGNFSVNTDKFTVTASSGDTSVAGTFGVTGATTLSSTVSVAGAISDSNGAIELTDADGVVLTGDLSDSNSAVVVNDGLTISGANSLLWGTDGGGDIGATGATRPANLFLSAAATVGTSATIGTTLTVGGNINDSDGNVYVDDPLDVNGTLSVLTGQIRRTGGDLDIDTATSGNVTLTPVGNVVFDPTSTYILPGSPYSENVGSAFAKYLSLHVAELNVDMLVSREKVATTGGWLAVTPSTQLVSPAAPGDSAIVVKHDNIASGDTLHLEARGQVEFMLVTDGGTPSYATAAYNTTDATDTETDTTVEWNHTLPSTGTNRVLIVALSFANGSSQTVTSVRMTQDSIDRYLSLANEAVNGTSARAEVWYLVDPPGGAVTITAVISGSVSAASASALLTGVDQRNPIRGTFDGSGSGATMTISFTGLTTNDLLVGAFGNSTAGTACTPTDTEQWDNTTTGIRGCGYTTTATGASDSLVATAAATAWAGAGVAFTPALTSISYAVTRNRDATGANQWLAGDAVLNYGAAADGWIELYAERSVRSASEVGPAVVINRRESNTFNDWEVRAAMGHLNSLYGQSSGEYGFAAGDPNDVNIVVTDSDGLLIREAGTTTRASLDTSGNLTLGDANNENAYITSTAVQLRDGSTAYTSLTGGALLLGRTGSGNENVYITAADGVQLRTDTTTYAQLSGTSLTLGESGSENVYVTSTGVQIRDGSTVYTDLTGGSLKLGTDTAGTNRTYTLIDSTNGMQIIRKDTSNVSTTLLQADVSGNLTMQGNIYVTPSTIADSLAVDHGINFQMSGEEDQLWWRGFDASTGVGGSLFAKHNSAASGSNRAANQLEAQVDAATENTARRTASVVAYAGDGITDAPYYTQLRFSGDQFKFSNAALGAPVDVKNNWSQSYWSLGSYDSSTATNLFEVVGTFASGSSASGRGMYLNFSNTSGGQRTYFDVGGIFTVKDNADAVNVTGTFGVSGATTLSSTVDVRGTISDGGDTEVYIDDTLKTSGAITERGRTVAMGEWTNLTSGTFGAISGTWTVDQPGDLTTFGYTLIGKTMTVSFWIAGTDVSTLNDELRITVPAGATVAKGAVNPFLATNAGGTAVIGYAFVEAGGQLIKLRMIGAQWASTSSDNTDVKGQITFEIQ